tara:strand:- start:950 stop:1723 length:774 start_codon:yes stop_codon:yes gene_type:complete
MTKTVFQKGSLNPENYINKPIHEKCCSFVINLERRTDRLKQFVNRYMPNDFIDLYIKKAVEGEKPNNPGLKKLKNGEYGCFLSHYQIWKYIKDNSIPYCCIYEDDVLFSKDYNTKLHRLLKELPMDFNILYLGGRFSCDYRSKNVSKVTENIYKHTCSPYEKPIKYTLEKEKRQRIGNKTGRWPGNDLDRTTQAYIISLKCATFLCEQICEENPMISMNRPVDHFLLDVLYKKNKLDILNSQPLIAWSPRKGDSDIR